MEYRILSTTIQTTMSHPTPNETFNYGNPPPMGNPVQGARFGVLPAPALAVPMRNYRGNSLMQPFHFRERLKRPEALMIYGMGLPSPDVARLVRARLIQQDGVLTVRYLVGFWELEDMMLFL
jgi:hypothetical protein